MNRRNRQSRWQQFKAAFNRTTPHWLNTFSQAGSVILAVIGIILTVMYAQRKTQIEDMEDVIIELKNQNRGQEEQINKQDELLVKLSQIAEQSTAMAKQSVEQVNKLSELQQIANEQNKTLRFNTQPVITLGGQFEYQFASDTIYYHCEFKNSGGRTAVGVQYSIKGFIINNDPKIPYTAGGKQNIDMPAGGAFGGIYWVTTNKKPDVRFLERLQYKVTVHFKDSYNGIQMPPAVFYVRHQLSDDYKIKETFMIGEAGRRQIDSLERVNGL